MEDHGRRRVPVRCRPQGTPTGVGARSVLGQVLPSLAREQIADFLSDRSRAEVRTAEMRVCDDRRVLEDEIERSRQLFRLEAIDATWRRPLNGVAVAEPRDWRETIGMLGLDRDDADLVVRTFPDPDRDPERWWLLERLRSLIVDGMPAGDPEVLLRRFDECGVLGTLFPVHVVASVVPEVLRLHRDRGVPLEVSRSTLALGKVLARDDSGVPIIDVSGWFVWRYRGLLYQVQTLRVIPVRLGEAPDSEAYYRDTDQHPSAPGHRRGDPALSLHIPAGPPLRSEDVRSALHAMAEAFASWFSPDEAPRIGTCGTWLLDPQLRRYLDRTSNIVQFQDVFTLFDDGRETDSIMPFVFPGYSGTPLDELPQDTTLQRAVVEHLRSGERWRSCNGWVEIG